VKTFKEFVKSEPIVEKANTNNVIEKIRLAYRKAEDGGKKEVPIGTLRDILHSKD